MKATWEEALPRSGTGKPIADCCSGLFGDLELDGSAGFPLDHHGAVPYSVPDAHVVDLKPHEITAPQLAVDGQIEQSEIASALFELKPDADCPDFFWLQRTLLADKPALIPGGAVQRGFNSVDVEHGRFSGTDPALHITDRPRSAVHNLPKAAPAS